MKLGISGQALGEAKSLREIIEILKSLDVNAVEIWPLNVPEDGTRIRYHASRYEARRIDRVKELLKEYDMKAACVTMPGAFDEEMASDALEYANALSYTVEVAGELGAPVVNHYCYHLAFEENPDMKRLMRYFEPALQKAEKLGVKLVLENEAHDATRTPEGMLKIMEAVGSKNFCTNYDACNYYHASQEGFPNAYEILKEHIAYVHLKGGCIYRPMSLHKEKNRGSVMTGGYAPHHIYYTAIPEGAVNFDGMLMRLRKDGYQGYCTLEPHAKPEEVESYCRGEVQYLRSRGFFIFNS